MAGGLVQDLRLDLALAESGLDLLLDREQDQDHKAPSQWGLVEMVE